MSDVGTIADQVVANTEDLSGQVDAGEAVSKGTDGADKTPQYVSKDEFEKFQEQFRRETQGLVDKNMSRVDKRIADANRKVEQFVETAKAVGTAFSPEQIEKMRSDLVQKAISVPDEVPAQAPQQTDPVLLQADAMIRLAGVDMNPNVPEWSMVDQKTQDPAVFIASLEKALQARKTNLTQAQTKQPTGDPAATPGMVGVGTEVTQDLMKQYRAELPSVQGNPTGLYHLKQKYRAKGLQV